MLSSIASPNIVSSNEHPRYLPLERRLIYISPYFKLSFFVRFLLNLEAESTDVVLSSSVYSAYYPKTNPKKKHKLQKSSFNCFLISLISLC